MKLVAVILVSVVSVLAGACESKATDSPEEARRRAECKQLEEHIFRITPESASRLAGLPEAEQRALLEQLVAKVPVEDLEQCVTSDPAVTTCMQAAPDIKALRACIPTPEQVKAAAEKKAAEQKAAEKAAAEKK